ncbi:MAG: ATP-binding cassette domain-containing protein [Ignavibacteriales bacterium]|nr:MAG: ATP-binding cassette domain-containing protein [Ignavibacteriaceae bacterium]MBW7872945.1 ATP-binding cassette domain-containing protein [Ignavibacteria bacterium]MCZ2142426.1 ATP-binding cassette domain-containing protein [Ignavibacteriales bacterium]OQY76353.1 MAG: ABC transporter ATP-binding protein [Ignavibacteriales bacterium UTCHB3]MBV6445308.1 Vitamin B12 import ATP-binding protein BtuD [Ignavibacteriaceae bacterium]
MLEVKNIRKEYKNVVAVDDVSFKVEPGKIFGLLGPNGAGKTTTIRMILDIIKPTAGEILIDGKQPGKEFQKYTGYLPEERGLYKKSKVLDIIKYFGCLKGMTPKDAENEGIQWLKRLEITDYKKRKVQELSKGNQQKIQFIIAVVHNPRILVLDEPFSGFDPINQEIVRDEILRLKEEGRTIILSTHQMDMAEKMCETIFLIANGKEVTGGPIKEVKRRFGKEIIKIEYEGNGDFIKGLPGVKTADLYGNFGEIETEDGIDPNSVLPAIFNGVALRSFSIEAPTLNRIFIDTIKQNENGTSSKQNNQGATR